MLALPDIHLGHGSGSSLPLPVLALAGFSTVVAVVVSGISIWLQLRNYRKPLLQRMVVRIMVMVPLYAVASFISLFSLEVAFFIDAVRDIYEAFVIYCFFVLLLDYLGGERSLLILLHGRPPIPAVFPVSLWRSEIDQSDPYTFLFLKRGILQYVQVKPLLALASLIMKATGTYNEGDFRARSGYLYVSVVYNISICLALWCLAVFWMCVHEDLKPFRPVPKFLCVKGILFFSFWQSIAISFLVAVGVITRLGPYTDNEHISLGLTDTLICIEMPFFAAAHMYAFSYRDFTNPAPGAGKAHAPIHVARMTFAYALRDALGLKDLVEDTRATLRGEGINYRAFEPSEGGMHIGAARDHRIRAGLRYAAGGKHKYWLPDARHPERDGDVTAPLFTVDDHDEGVHEAPDVDGDVEGEYALTFDDGLAGPTGVDEVLYEDAKKYVFGDYLYPVADVSSEEARRAVWEEEERVVRDIASGRTEGAAAFSAYGYGATQSGKRQARAYDDEEDEGHGDPGRDSPRSSRTVRPHQLTPSPPRPRNMRDPRPMTSRSSSYQSRPRSPAQSSRLHPPSVRPSGSVSTSASVSASSSPRAPKRAPLVAEDAVDLVVAVPSIAQGPHSPHSPALIRVWDKVGPGPATQDRIVEEEDGPDEEDGRESDVPRFVITAEDDENGAVMGQTPPRGEFGVGIAEEEDGNPWA